MRRAVVVGRSAGALAEYAAACELCTFDDVIVIGKMGEVFPDRIDHWVSFHANLFAKWAETRAVLGLFPATCCWGAEYRGRRLDEGVPAPMPRRYIKTIGGSSGFMGVQVALDELRDDRVVLAGIPMSADHCHAILACSPQEIDAPWTEADTYWETWEEHMPRLLGRVKSMSGRTRQLLGEPTHDWLYN